MKARFALAIAVLLAIFHITPVIMRGIVAQSTPDLINGALLMLALIVALIVFILLDDRARRP